MRRIVAASVIAAMGRMAISTRRVAMCAPRLVDGLVDALLWGHDLHQEMNDALGFLAKNARRAHPKRDGRSGRLKGGLGLEKVTRWCPG